MEQPNLDGLFSLGYRVIQQVIMGKLTNVVAIIINVLHIYLIPAILWMIAVKVGM